MTKTVLSNAENKPEPFPENQKDTDMTDYKKALRTAASLCSRKEYCSTDIRRKLEKFDISAEDTERIIDYLEKNNFIDETRFATFYARDKFRFNKWGKLKISQMLKQKGISPAVIESALRSLGEEDYQSTCLHLLQQKLKSLKKGEPAKMQNSLIRFALGRGFDYDVIRQCLKQLSVEKPESSQWDS